MPIPEQSESAGEEAAKHLDTQHEASATVETVDANGIMSQDLAAALAEREGLRKHVSELRETLELSKESYEKRIALLSEKLDATQEARDLAEGRYQKLLGQINTIKKQLGERLKADADDLKQAQSRIEELEKLNTDLASENSALQSQVSLSKSSRLELELEFTSLRERNALSQKNWVKERDQLFSQEAQLREEFEAARQAMQDWEVLAMEERSVRESLTENVTQLTEQLSAKQQAFERAVLEQDTQATTVDGLQRALQELHEARKQELREVVENSQTRVEELQALLKTNEQSADRALADLEGARQELERLTPFEKEVKEKNLLIGKLRHEAVILNDHLTKALKFLRRGRPEESVDRQLVTNHLIHFLALDRSDPKKFQILQLISALLGWTDDQNEAAGLTRPGVSSQALEAAQHSSLRVPFSSFRRISSSSGLSSQRSASPSMTLVGTMPSSPLKAHQPIFEAQAITGDHTKSITEMWSEFLEREAQEGLTRGSQLSANQTSTVDESQHHDVANDNATKLESA